ncbi:PstS family phosphate ABC transporter substrate-binding protein [Campylobacter ureolyticus]|uniref:PstS family phosphate ABC transporter substrate-binding protein n=1 Tax=Campylobacter ureolyticus TaxID=827 RepID=UPI0022B57A91|nr:substrate-binding domain-containing protein [Campylobacter ureolyticus]MCZ6157670.1 substrate-binding domain-containing protein [Campylobacter ureolyticus]
MIKLLILIIAGILSFGICFIFFGLYIFVYSSGDYEGIVYALIILLIWLFFMKFFFNLLDTGKNYKKPLFICLFICLSFGIYTYFLEKDLHIKQVNTRINLDKFAPFIDFNDPNLELDLKDKIALHNPNLASIKSDFKFKDNPPLIDGATALYPIYAAFVESIYPPSLKYYPCYTENSIAKCSTTNGAYENLINQKVDIIFVAGASKEQLNLAKDKNVTMEFLEIGKEAFVFFVNSKNSLDNLSVDEVVKIYSEKITNYKEVGGKNAKILAFQRDKNSGSQTMLEKIMAGKELMQAPATNVVGDMAGIVKSVGTYKNYKNALGFSFLYFTKEMVKNSDIKLLKINGIYPNSQSILNETYPFVGKFYAVTLKENKKESVKEFLEWLKSSEAKLIIQKTGYTPL